MNVALKSIVGWIGLSVLGKLSPSKTDEFSEKFQRGGGVIFNPKIYVADFCHCRQYFGHEFQKKIAT